jgi:hypothetical protein
MDDKPKHAKTQHVKARFLIKQSGLELFENMPGKKFFRFNKINPAKSDRFHSRALNQFEDSYIH